MIIRKSPEEIARMARAGAVVAAAHEEVAARLRPGMTTLELDAIAEGVIRGHGAVPSFKGYRGFPATLCTSKNDQIVHGIPSDQVVLDEGSVISIDCGAIVEGFHGDSAVTLIVGGDDAVAPEVAQLVRDTRTALWRGLEQVAAGNRLGDVGAAIEAVATAQGYGVVREYVGHGIGRALHEDPSVPNYGTAGRGSKLTPGWVIAVEPMFNLGTERTRTLEDGWTVVTADGSISAHWEHTIAITEDGPVVLTARSDEPSHLGGQPSPVG
ncbi:type I methionyl aminopeptidase [Nitriliruptor alkaliphilus]|uniref:type I methionyl aminopeptidase n=1 Tax=Nitriliruptor alkaliphilus TaxID=427918 RepID=UPI000695D5DA|nr:type I methionyl aminopeptidase [Nitriliruptor alkaliphilus]